jgi:hypothetical protein
MNQTRTTKRVYFNDPQQQFIYTAAKTNVIVAGRRMGKTFGFGSQFLLRNVQFMPRGNHAILTPSYKHGLSQTLPGTLEALEYLGYVRDRHYYIGRRPPKTAGFATPYRQPANYENIISWYNGSVSTIISQDRKGSSNSLTIDSLTVDEARFINYEKFKDETVPAMGGFKGYFSHLPWNHAMLIMSDMPTSANLSWFEKYKEKSDDDLILTIQALVVEIWDLKEKFKITKSNLLLKQINSLRKQMAQLQSVALFYKEYSSLENLAIVGKEYFAQMKRDLPPLVFQSSILCKRVKLIRDGFYAAINPDIHYYTAFDNSYLDSLDFNFKRIKNASCLQDGDLNRHKPISIAFDYNANINWLVAGQREGVKMKVLKSFYVKYERKLGDLVKDFCNYYRHQINKEVVYYFDNTAIGTNYAIGDDDFASAICDEFARNNWKVIRVHIGNPVKHIEKHRMIHQSLVGSGDYLFPQINKPNNEPLIIAIESAGIRLSSRGFTKDKAGEKLDESELNLLEHRTDGTDAFDTLFIGMNKFPIDENSAALTSSFI